MTVELEEGHDLRLDFSKIDRTAGTHVLPCAVQDVDTNEVILVAYVDEIALQCSVESRSAIFWSTSRNELWEKGAISGETFELVEVRVNCEQNSLVYLVRPHAAVSATQKILTARRETASTDGSISRLASWIS